MSVRKLAMLLGYRTSYDDSLSLYVFPKGCKSVVDIRGSEFDMINSKHQPSVCTVTNGIEASEAISEKVQPHPTIRVSFICVG